jgi:protein-L-isoaspartate(D-aspartate) O-methyltransferase
VSLEREREEMVSSQIEARGVSDPDVLRAMRLVPRHEFVPSSLLREAHSDYPLPVGEGQTISQPYIVALMTERLRAGPGDRVLEVGCGTGYQAAVLAEVVGPEGSVVSVERIGSLARSARERLARLGYRTVTVVEGDGTLGHPPLAPYDGIVVTAAAPAVPPPLLDQLRPGRTLVIPVGGSFLQELLEVRVDGGRAVERPVCGCRFVPLIGEAGWRDAFR